MKILYIFPHPDDESFGPGPVIAKQVEEGHEIYLLDLTKGGATKMRFKFNYTIEQMGEVREKETQEAAKRLGIKETTILDFPDSGLAETDPRELEKAIKEHIEKIKPEIVVTYAVHGISGFHDHLVGHAAVKRAFIEMKEMQEHTYLKRLVFTTLSKEQAEEEIKQGWLAHINHSKKEAIDCAIQIEEKHRDIGKHALDAYETYLNVINESNIKEMLDTPETYYEIFQEDFKPPLDDMTTQLPN